MNNALSYFKRHWLSILLDTLIVLVLLTYPISWLAPGSATAPGNWKDVTLRPPQRIANWFLQQSQCAEWDWYDYFGTVATDLVLEGDPAAGNDPANWQKAAVVEPKGAQKNWRLGFVASTSKRFCSVLLTGRATVRIGPEATGFFGIDIDGRVIPLQLIKTCPKNQAEGLLI